MAVSYNPFPWLAPLLLVVIATAANAQPTLFTTEDYRRDRGHWTDPAYYGYNTARELTDMSVEDRYGEAGSRADTLNLKSPYAYKTSQEHYQAWLEAAKGGTKHTLQSLPDWDGQWAAGATWLDSRQVQGSTIAAALTPQYQEFYVQQVKAESEGRHWWPQSFCLPIGFIRGILGAEQFVIRPQQVLIVNNRVTETQVRWVHTDSTGHQPEDAQFARWAGESIGFWDGASLIVHTNQIRAWNGGHSMFEWSDKLMTVERYERVGDTIQGEITMYDPSAFVSPLHARLTFSRNDDPASRPIYNTCTDTNGPSSNIYANEKGFLDERTPGEPGYWDPTDPRPWARHYSIGERP